MPIKRHPHNPLYRVRDAQTGEVLIRFRSKNKLTAMATARKNVWLNVKKDPGFQFDLERYESDLVGWRAC
jgi:hypothetical protein